MSVPPPQGEGDRPAQPVGGGAAATSATATGEPTRLHPATLIVRWLKIVPQMLGAAAAGFASMRGAPGRLLLFVGLAGLIGGALALLSWWRFRYTVGVDEIVIESGVLRRQRRVIPYDRIQDVSIERRLLARLFGTAKVKIETGGSGADEGDLDMIAIADALALRDHLRRVPPRYGDEQVSRAARGSALSGGQGDLLMDHPDAGPAEQEPILFELRLGRLLYSGLFNFSLLFLAAIFALLQNLEQFGLFDPKDWLTPERTEAAAGYFNLRYSLILVPVVLALGMVSGVARTVGKDFGFRLTRTPAGLRRRRGLFTLSEVVIPLRRTQVAVIESGILGRWLGWYQLSFETLGADRKEGGVQVAAPFARMDEILPILAEAGFPAPPPPAEFLRTPRRALVRRVGFWLLLAIVAAAAALPIDSLASAAAAIVLGLALVAVLRWRKQGYALGERALFVARGLFTRRLSIVPFEKAQTLSVSRGPVQRGLRLASLLVDTAGASLMQPAEIHDMDSAAADRLADRLLVLFHEGRRRARVAASSIR